MNFLISESDFTLDAVGAEGCLSRIRQDDLLRYGLGLPKAKELLQYDLLLVTGCNVPFIQYTSGCRILKIQE